MWHPWRSCSVPVATRSARSSDHPRGRAFRRPGSILLGGIGDQDLSRTCRPGQERGSVDGLPPQVIHQAELPARPSVTGPLLMPAVTDSLRSNSSSSRRTASRASRAKAVARGAWSRIPLVQPTACVVRVPDQLGSLDPVLGTQRVEFLDRRGRETHGSVRAGDSPAHRCPPSARTTTVALGTWSITSRSPASIREAIDGGSKLRTVSTRSATAAVSSSWRVVDTSIMRSRFVGE